MATQKLLPNASNYCTLSSILRTKTSRLLSVEHPIYYRAVTVPSTMLNLAYLKIKNSGMFVQLECSSNRTQLQYIYTHGCRQKCMGYFLEYTRPSLVWTSLSRTSDYPDSTQLFGCALKLYSQIFTYPNRGRSQTCEGLLYIIDSMQQCRCVLRFFYTSYPQTP